MATAEQYAAWIVSNQDKKGSPDFERVAEAYKIAKGGQVPRETAPAQQDDAGGIVGALESAATIGSGIIAEPIAGLAGLVQTINPFADPGAGAEAVKATKEALTYEPQTQAGRESLKTVGETVKKGMDVVNIPISGIGGLAELILGQGIDQAMETLTKIKEGGISQQLGERVYEETGSPLAASIATAAPTAVVEALGVGAARKAAKAGRIPKGKAITGKVSNKTVEKTLLESAPEVSQIKDASRALYKEIDDLNVLVKPEAAKSLLNKVVRKSKIENVDDVLTPKSARVVKQFEDELLSNRPRSVSELDQIRKKAQIAAQSVDPSDARVGAIMVDEIDDFLDKIPQSAFSGRDAKNAAMVGGKYADARKLWGRARRSELISEAFDKANRQASGFENGLRTQFRQILNNKKRSRFFTADELKAMDDVVKGATGQNTLKLIGRLGFSEGGATNILGGLVGAGVLGPGAPVIGQISRKLAQKSTAAAAKRVETLIRGGANGKSLTKAYLQTVPKGKRSVQELSDILLASGSKLDDLVESSNKLIKEAAEIAKARKILDASQVAGSVAPQAVTTAGEQE